MAGSLQRALEFHKTGHLDQAELLYRNLLDDEPNHAEALHLLGVILHQRGQAEKAVRFMRRAVELQPNAAVMHCNLAEAYRAAGNLPEAVEHSQKAIRLQPHHADGHNHLGLALQGLGKLEEAVAAYRAAIGLRPDFALALNNLGSALRELKGNDEAEACFRDALSWNPNLALAHSNLGQLLVEQNRADQALPHCQRAVELNPNFAEALSNLGNVLRAQDKLSEAKECYKKALTLRPNVAMIHNNLGQALQEEGNLDEAIACYRKAIGLDPRSARIECHLASALAAQEKPKEAIVHYRRALDLQPDWADAHNGLGHLLQEGGDLEAALACFQEALRLKPDLADAHANVANVLAEKGDLAGSERSYREALKHDPDYVGAYGVLATHLRDKLPEADVAIMRQFLQRDHLSDWKRALLHHGLAHIHDARKEYDEAGEHARKANAYRKETWHREGKVYNRNDHDGFVSFLIKQFQPAFFQRVQGWGLATDVPVFVLGLPRSGTTLLEQILASHPRVHGAGELTLGKDSFDMVPAQIGRTEPPAVVMPVVTKKALQEIGKVHLNKLREFSPQALRIVDKMPDNYLWLGFLSALFPRAKFIYSRRDVRDVSVSCWITNFKQIRWACDTDDLAGRIKSHLRIMDHWRRVLPVPLLEIDYEETVADIEAVARRMIDFVGLEWDPACIKFHETQRTVRTASLTQVRQPIYKGSVERWRLYEKTLGPLFRALDGAVETI
ncbi:MAG: tetratricopeptide repeat protein [Planctomycetes bacterium]|nr:tetratricopeptide repeat protein [Planctomycetota bacterium]